MVGTDIYCGYKIEKAPETLEPNDEIEGIFIIENRGKKEKKLKKAFIRINELYLEKMIYKDPETGEETKKYEDRKNTLKTEDIVKGDKIKAGEKKEIKFKLNMPGSWSKKKKNKIKDWRLEMWFIQKSAMVGSRGSHKDDATCVLPVKGSKRSPSFGIVPKKEKKKD
ncbi:MAG: hypothetical protein JSV62_05920 [Promethearchaeota archaeon]|nr:MAG: hypothetical protein JSV62_05920 [Candidatus Lokiarchaeota archaeon]